MRILAHIATVATSVLVTLGVLLALGVLPARPVAPCPPLTAHSPVLVPPARDASGTVVVIGDTTSTVPLWQYVELAGQAGREARSDVWSLKSRIDCGLRDGRDMGVVFHEWADDSADRPVLYGAFGSGR
jgi:hypothetical protein